MSQTASKMSESLPMFTRSLAEVEHGMARFLQVALQHFLKVEAGMIRRDRDGAPRHSTIDPL